MIAKGSGRSVFVDLSPLAADGSNGGSRPYVMDLLGSLLSREDPHHLHLMVKRDAEDLVEPLVARGAVTQIVGADGEVPEPKRLLREWRRRAAALARVVPGPGSLLRLGAEVLLSPLGTAAFHEPGLPHVVVAYDFQELAYPAFFDERELARRQAFRADLLRATAVVAISEATRSDAVSLAGVPASHVRVIRPRVPFSRVPWRDPEALADRLKDRGLELDRYALYPANFWPHKNHDRLLLALASVPEARLVLCGALDAARTALQERSAALGLSERVVVLPYVGDEELTALLQGARLLIFPSLFEGFGLPVLEAFALGVPVACSALSALEELSDGAAHLFDPKDPAAIALALRTLWNAVGARRRAAEKGRARAAALAAEDTAGAWHELLASV